MVKGLMIFPKARQDSLRFGCGRTKGCLGLLIVPKDCSILQDAQ
jgi:hypothetical protein